MNPTQYIASNIMNQFLPQVISDLGECDICDLVSLYLDRGELPHPLEGLKLERIDQEALVELCTKMNGGRSTVQP